MTFLSMTHGDTAIFQTTISNLTSGGLSGCSFWFTAKYAPGDADAAAAFQKLPASFSIVQVGNSTTPGIISVTLAPTDTSSLPYVTMLFYYDIQMKDSIGNIFTVDAGYLQIRADVTRATS